MHFKLLNKVIQRYHSFSVQFVPKHNSVSEKDIETLKEFIGNSQKMLVLTGAGISTESG